MKDYSVILFDLDGTLTDPEGGLVRGFEYALCKMGLPKEEKAALRRFIGPPLLDEWQKEYSLTKAETETMIRYFREYYDIYGWWDNVPYAGIKEELTKLRLAGKRLMVATSKPERTAMKVLSLFGLTESFDFIGGAASEKERYTKDQVLEYVLKENSVDRERAILVGDRKYDAEGAALCGIDSLGVLWGHGSAEEINASGFTATVNSVADISLFFGVC